MLKRVFAILSGRDFCAFLRRAREDGLSMGEALAVQAHLYASGESPSLRGHGEYLRKIKSEDDSQSKKKLGEVEM